MQKPSSTDRSGGNIRKPESRRPAEAQDSLGKRPHKSPKDSSFSPRSTPRPGVAKTGKFVPGSISGSRQAPVSTSGGYRPGSIILRSRKRTDAQDGASENRRSSPQNL